MMTKNPRRGRPPKPADSRATKLLAVRLTTAELAHIKAAARDDAMTVAEWTRARLIPE